MLPDNFPVFNIELECDFESSDNVYPAYCPHKSTAGCEKGGESVVGEE